SGVWGSARRSGGTVPVAASATRSDLAGGVALCILWKPDPLARRGIRAKPREAETTKSLTLGFAWPRILHRRIRRGMRSVGWFFDRRAAVFTGWPRRIVLAHVHPAWDARGTHGS